jgi:signal transduction histidine kinase
MPRAKTAGNAAGRVQSLVGRADRPDTGKRPQIYDSHCLLQVALADPNADTQSLRATCEEALQLGEQQGRLIDGLLTLATSERGIERWEPFDLAEIVERIVASRRQEAERQDISIRTALTETTATGEPSLVESLVANLLDNAVRHNVTGGRIEISTATTPGRATISVSNTGALIGADQVDRLFQPFQRLGSDRIHQIDGNGLGLAIVRAITTAYGASLAARARPEGGLDIEVGFPTRAT